MVSAAEIKKTSGGIKTWKTGAEDRLMKLVLLSSKSRC
jgi:hypothetical protein